MGTLFLVPDRQSQRWFELLFLVKKRLPALSCTDIEATAQGAALSYRHMVHIIYDTQITGAGGINSRRECHELPQHRGAWKTWSKPQGVLGV